MNHWNVFSALCFFCALIFLIIGSIQGEISIVLLVIFPIILGSGLFALTGFMFLFLAFILLFIGRIKTFSKINNVDLSDTDTSMNKPSLKTGGVILIGPIPIIFGSNWIITLIFGLIGIFLFILLLSFFYHFI